MSAVDFTTARSGTVKGPGPRIPIHSGSDGHVNFFDPEAKARVKEIFAGDTRERLSREAQKRRNKRRRN